MNLITAAGCPSDNSDLVVKPAKAGRFDIKENDLTRVVQGRQHALQRRSSTFVRRPSGRPLWSLSAWQVMEGQHRLLHPCCSGFHKVGGGPEELEYYCT